MKKYTQLFIAFAFSLIFISCSKEESTSNLPSSISGSFTWTDNTGLAVTADSAYYDSQYKTIKAFKGGNTRFIEINLTAGTPATYVIGVSNAFTYLNASNIYIATSGSIVITANASSKMSGTFATAGNGASITSMTGTFTDIAVR